MTHRISKTGSFRIDRRFRGVGRIALASGTTERKMFRKLNTMLSELYEDGHLDILSTIKHQNLSLQEVYQARRTGRLPYLASELVLQRNLWSVVRDWCPRSALSDGTRKRYAVSFRALKRSGVLVPSATVGDLRSVDWNGVRCRWGGGSADWNRLRSAVSRFLTMVLGDKYHPFRRDIMTRFPRAKESQGRVPDLTVEMFWEIVWAAPVHVRPAYVILAATGLRVGEYLDLHEHHLLPMVKGIRVPGTKTEASEDVVRVGNETWKWLRKAVPSPVQYKWLRIHWKRACEAVGARDLRLHDLRHFYGQVLTDGGRPEVSVQHGLRHRDPSMTRRYTRQKDRGENARLMDEILFPKGPEGVQKGA